MTKETKTQIATSVTASAVNLGLGLTKLFVGLVTHSISILGDGINNFGDVVSNAGAAVGFGFMHKAPSEKYPFGYGRVEYVVSFLMAILIVVVGGVFAYTALDRIFYHPVVTFAWTQFGIIAATIVVKLLLALMFGLTFRKFRSEVLKAQTLDSIMDAFITLFALTGLFLSRYIQFPIDALFGIIISVVLIVAGFRIMVPAFRRLAGARDEARTVGLTKLSEAQNGVESAQVRLYDFGKHYAEANVALRFSDDADEETRKVALEKIADTARKNNIIMTFTEYKEEV